MKLRFNPERPIYQQIIDEFKRAIARGELAPGDRIPSQRELATQARINPNTVQRAYREMEWLGLTETLRGQGTFVVQAAEPLRSLRHDMAAEAVDSFIAEMSALGFTGEAMVQMAQAAVEQRLAEQTSASMEGDGKPNGDTRNSGTSGAENVGDTDDPVA